MTVGTKQKLAFQNKELSLTINSASTGFYFLNIQVLHSSDILKQEDIYDI
jgi:hypothetical protein